ncbi:hypothetical protein LDENG_00208790 [Lucifuga dentata]|nr:hypothetical protein LDENG_00208790 [Lucifuga dentata]
MKTEYIRFKHAKWLVWSFNRPNIYPPQIQVPLLNHFPKHATGVVNIKNVFPTFQTSIGFSSFCY